MLLLRHIMVQSGADTEADFKEFFPRFMWVLRDFSLQLEADDGSPLSAQQYLERSLQPERGVSQQVSQRNRVRLLLTSFFSHRDCAPLQRPLLDEAELVRRTAGWQCGAMARRSHIATGRSVIPRREACRRAKSRPTSSGRWVHCGNILHSTILWQESCS